MPINFDSLKAQILKYELAKNPEIIKEHFKNLYPDVQVFVEID